VLRRESHRLSRPFSTAGWCSAAVLALIVLLAGLAPWIGLPDPLAMSPPDRLQPPGAQHLLGTDPFGRDLASRLVWGSRRTLAAAAVAVLITLGGGLPLGLLAGYHRGWIDELIVRVVDVLLAFPGVLMILGLVALLGPGSRTVALAVGITGVPVMTRVVRSAVLSVREEAFVEAARSVGCRAGRVVVRHLLPNVAGPVIAFTAVQFGWAMLNATAVSFLGLGESPAVPEWGTMLNLGRGYLRSAPWASAVPGLAITVTVLCVNLLSDTLQDRWNPPGRG